MNPSIVETCLRTPELLVSVFRFLGPIDWLKCSSVCSWWWVAILDKPQKRGSSAAPPGEPSNVETVLINLWREFAISVQSYRPPDEARADSPAGDKLGTDGSSSREGKTDDAEGAAGGTSPTTTSVFIHVGTKDGSSRTSRPRRTDAMADRVALGRTGTNAGRRRTKANQCPYKHVCLEGDPAQLGPPPRPRCSDDAHIIKLSIQDVRAAAVARERKPRALLKMLRFYMVAMPVQRGKPRPTVSSSQHEIVLSFPTGGASALPPSSPSEAGPNRRRRTRPRPGQFLSVATDLVDNGLRDYTRLLVLCGRCRRPHTALYASAGRRGATPGSDSSSAASRSSPAGGGGGLSLFVECHSQDCGITSEVSSEGGPGWLPRFARYVSKQEWEDINTLPPDHGTEWFSDTSPEAVRRRREEAQAESCGLDALASWREGREGDDES